ncbi:hypothetical protein ES703_114235 [subsurface metagenome]
MPTYEYLCQSCGHTFEQFQSITAKPLKKCPDCKKPKLKRLIGTGAGIIFKGSGFYETDYRSDGYKKDQKADKPETSETGDKKTSDKKDTKSTDTKKDPTPQKDSPKTSPAKKKLTDNTADYNK